MRSLYQSFYGYSRKINWTLFIFLVLLLNVKLIIKLLAFLVIAISTHRRISFKDMLQQKQLFFYAGVICIGAINYLLTIKNTSLNAALATGFGIFLWVICAAASYYLYQIVQSEKKERLYSTIDLFFIAHIAVVFLNIIRIMIECGDINPYTYKGLNQKYYISTGDFVSGISFDSPVTTAMISAFALLYFLYRRHFVLSLAAMVSLLLLVSNLTNILVVLILVFIFIFKTDRQQKSIIVVQICILAIFTAKISPQNFEYVGRFAYKMIDKPYDLPPKNESAAWLKASPDSILNPKELKKKTALVYIDSVSTLKQLAVLPAKGSALTMGKNAELSRPKPTADSLFFVYKESEAVVTKKDKYSDFIEKNFTASAKDSLEKRNDWNKPGKWIAAKELVQFFKAHPSRTLLGAGVGNFSSRTAFKTTSLGIAGGYPAKFSYIHPWFLNNHLYLYTHYHTKPQAKHAAENTPDSTYGQLLGEYGIMGVLLFAIFYAFYFLRKVSRKSFGLPILLLMLGMFAVEYWFDQLSIVILFEVLLFLDIKSAKSESTWQEEGQPV